MLATRKVFFTMVSAYNSTKHYFALGFTYISLLLLLLQTKIMSKQVWKSKIEEYSQIALIELHSYFTNDYLSLCIDARYDDHQVLQIVQQQATSNKTHRACLQVRTHLYSSCLVKEPRLKTLHQCHNLLFYYFLLQLVLFHFHNAVT